MRTDMSVNQSFYLGYGVVLERAEVKSVLDAVDMDIYDFEDRLLGGLEIIDLDPMIGKKGYLFAVEVTCLGYDDTVKVLSLDEIGTPELPLKFLGDALPQELLKLLGSKRPNWVIANVWS
jgi:hypothetical protein